MQSRLAHIEHLLDVIAAHLAEARADIAAIRAIGHAEKKDDVR